MDVKLNKEQPEAKQQQLKSYEKPAIVAEETFELMSLSCPMKSSCAAANVPPSG
ncbi:MAG: hypothetical protein JXR76_22130 [Deltaproteobacteria bacterium]|nr:hypothetical protein [Deltaproteobacteria bacterium]